MFVFLDIGSTLIDGPSRGPARRLAESLQLAESAVARLTEILFCCPLTGPEDLASRIVATFHLNPDIAYSASDELWHTQNVDAYALEGAREALARLDAAGIQRAYVSNIWPPFYEAFTRLFPDEAVRWPRFLSFAVGLMKPDLRMYETALDELHLLPTDVVMIGDTYRMDVAPAQALGMKTIWLLHRPNKELLDIVDVLNGTLPAPDRTLGAIGELTADCIFSLGKVVDCPADTTAAIGTSKRWRDNAN